MINIKNRAGRGCAAGQGDAAIRQKPRKKEQYLLQSTALGVTEKCPCGWLPAQPAWCFDYYEIDAADLQ